jgi:hypothetical protein
MGFSDGDPSRSSIPKECNELHRQTTPTGYIDPKELSGALANPPTLPLVVAEWDRNAREVIRVALDQFSGRHTINLRVWYREGGSLKPGKSGITLSLGHLPALTEAMGKALGAARELGLITDETGQ